MQITFNLYHLLIFAVAIIVTYFITKATSKPKTVSQYDNRVVVDTSSLIDGRLLEISKTGFITGELFVPKFVLDELQQVADSSDPLKRNKGRRGLEVLKKLQKSQYFRVDITDIDFPDVDEVDEKLIKLSREKNAKLMTVDFNLNERSKIEGLTVLNINRLSNSIKPLYLPGQSIEVKVVQPGKERNQGVGYLEDGTMIVVEEGAPHIGKRVEAQVSRIFQTDAGRMIFVKLKENIRGREVVDTRKPKSWLPFLGRDRNRNGNYRKNGYFRNK